MKSGTSSLHYLLNHHPDVFMPQGEVYFFDIDDIQQHPDFFVQTAKGWTFHDYNKDFESYLTWYRTLFDEADDDQVIGERSTTYMASQMAPERIAALLPNAKLIFMLRDPVSRTYSQYWHFVRTGRVFHGFEKALQYTPGTLLQRSFYKRQIARYKSHFPDQNMKFVIFESFVADGQSAVDGICQFLELGNRLNTDQVATRQNPARVARSIELQLICNRLFRGLTGRTYLGSRLPHMSSPGTSKWSKALARLIRMINRPSRSEYPPMRSETKTFLQEFFAEENRGLSELIKVEVQEYWPYMPS